MAAPPKPDLSLVVPVFNESDTVDVFLAEVTPVLDATGMSWEIVWVNDGSRDDTLARLVAAATSDARLRVVDLTRNFGKEAALTAGLAHAAGRAVIPMDVDLQDPPEVIPDMIARWRDGYDVVYGRRVSRGEDTAAKRLTAGLFYKLINTLSPIDIPDATGDFRLMDRRVVEDILRLPERNRFMKGLFAWVGYRQAAVEYERRPRSAGDTKFSYWKLWNFAIDGITAFSTTPLRVWTYVGLTIAGLAGLYGSYLILRTLIHGVDVPGYPSIMVVILFLNGMQLVTLGIIGEYVGRLYQESKGRPIYLVRDTFGIPREGDGA